MYTVCDCEKGPNNQRMPTSSLTSIYVISHVYFHEHYSFICIQGINTIQLRPVMFFSHTYYP